MRAIQVYEYGPADSMRLEEIADPAPQAGQVLVRVSAAGVNPVDWKRRSGAYHSIMPVTFPWTPGVDLSGTVESVGEGSGFLVPGQKVFGIGKGTYAQFAIAKASDLALIPESIGFQEAATLGLGGLTAWGAVRDLNIKPGSRVLIHGAAGGVGYFALQIAKSLGAECYATASTSNVDFVRSLGADRVVDYTAEAFDKVLSGLDAVLDTVGGETLQRSYAVVRQGGIVASIAGSSDEAACAAKGITGKRTGQAPGSELAHIVELVRKGLLKPLVGTVYPLERAAGAHTESEGRHGRGRIVLTVS